MWNGPEVALTKQGAYVWFQDDLLDGKKRVRGAEEVWYLLASAWAGSADQMRRSQDSLGAANNMDFVTFALRRVKHSALHRPKIGRINHKGAPWEKESGQVEFAVQTSPCAEKGSLWMNGCCALGKDTQGTWKHIENTVFLVEEQRRLQPWNTLERT